jgi:hypothetical protein
MVSRRRSPILTEIRAAGTWLSAPRLLIKRRIVRHVRLGLVTADADRREKSSDQLRHGGQLPGHNWGNHVEITGWRGTLVRPLQAPFDDLQGVGRQLSGKSLGGADESLGGADEAGADGRMRCRRSSS